MDRRKFLRASMLGFTPFWLACSFRARYDPGVERRTKNQHSLKQSYEQAQKLGKPLLVIVATKNKKEDSERGSAFGEFFSFGGEELWPLSMCEVACATRKEISSLVRVWREPLFYLLEDEGNTIKATAFDEELPSWFGLDATLRGHPSDKEINAIIDQRISILSKLVHQSLVKDETMLQDRASLVKKTLFREEETENDQMPSLEYVDRFAAVLALYASKSSESNRKMLLQTLASSAEVKLRANQIPGSRWVTETGCGTYFDGEPVERHYACGMGYVPKKSRRFLWFYTK